MAPPPLKRRRAAGGGGGGGGGGNPGCPSVRSVRDFFRPASSGAGPSKKPASPKKARKAASAVRATADARGRVVPLAEVEAARAEEVTPAKRRADEGRPAGAEEAPEEAAQTQPQLAPVEGDARAEKVTPAKRRADEGRPAGAEEAPEEAAQTQPQLAPVEGDARAEKVTPAKRRADEGRPAGAEEAPEEAAQTQPQLAPVEGDARAEKVTPAKRRADEGRPAGAEEAPEEAAQTQPQLAPAEDVEDAVASYDPAKCRSFTEVPHDQVCDTYVVGRRVQVYWDDDHSWYDGVVHAFDAESGAHTFMYDDGDSETMRLSGVRVRYHLAPSESLRGPPDGGTAGPVYAPWCDDPVRLGVGEVVWVTMRGYPSWPARVVAPADGLSFEEHDPRAAHVTRMATSVSEARARSPLSPLPVLVQYFGTHDWGVVRLPKEARGTSSAVALGLLRPSSRKARTAFNRGLAELASYLRAGVLPPPSTPPVGLRLSEVGQAHLPDEADDASTESLSNMGSRLAPKAYTPMPLAQGAHLLSLGRPHPYARAFHEKAAVYPVGLTVARPEDGTPLPPPSDGSIPETTTCQLLEIFAAPDGRSPVFRVSCGVPYAAACRAALRREERAATSERELADAIAKEVARDPHGNAELKELADAGYPCRPPTPLDVGCLPLSVAPPPGLAPADESEAPLTCTLQILRDSAKEAWAAVQEAILAAEPSAKARARAEAEATKGDSKLSRSKKAASPVTHAFAFGYARVRKALLRRAGGAATRARWMPNLALTASEELLEASLGAAPVAAAEGDAPDPAAVAATAAAAGSREDAEDVLLALLERWFRPAFDNLLAKRTTPPGPLVHAPLVDRCDICRTEADSEESVLLQCAGCLVVVHEKCYGTDTTVYARGDRPWLCDMCADQARAPAPIVRAASQPRSAPVPCALCPVVGGAYKRVCPESSQKYAEKVAGKSARARCDEIFYKTRYVHSLCALYMPEVSFIDEAAAASDAEFEPSTEQLRGLEHISQKRRELRCAVCEPNAKAAGGASAGDEWPPRFPCIQCFHPKCFVGMHPMCAMNSARFTAEYVSNGDIAKLERLGLVDTGKKSARLEDGASFVAMCARHSPEFQRAMREQHSAQKEARPDGIIPDRRDALLSTTPVTTSQSDGGSDKENDAVQKPHQGWDPAERKLDAGARVRANAPPATGPMAARMLAPRARIPAPAPLAEGASPVPYLIGASADRRLRLQAHLSRVAGRNAAPSCLVPATNGVARDAESLRESGPALGGPALLANAARLGLSQSLHASRLALVRSAIHGNGLACKAPLRRGELVVEYVGQLVRTLLSDLRERRSYNASECVGASGTYTFGLPRSVYAENAHVDATFCGNAARLANHSCDPNCASRIVDVGKDGCRVALFALRDIAAFEELTYDYRMASDAVDLVCRCGAPTCRGTVNVRE